MYALLVILLAFFFKSAKSSQVKSIFIQLTQIHAKVLKYFVTIEITQSYSIISSIYDKKSNNLQLL